jgi:hypothetical protein
MSYTLINPPGTTFEGLHGDNCEVRFTGTFIGKGEPEIETETKKKILEDIYHKY